MSKKTPPIPRKLPSVRIKTNSQVIDEKSLERNEIYYETPIESPKCMLKTNDSDVTQQQPPLPPSTPVPSLSTCKRPIFSTPPVQQQREESLSRKLTEKPSVVRLSSDIDDNSLNIKLNKSEIKSSTIINEEQLRPAVPEKRLFSTSPTASKQLIVDTEYEYCPLEPTIKSDDADLKINELTDELIQTPNEVDVFELLTTELQNYVDDQTYMKTYDLFENEIYKQEYNRFCADCGLKINNNCWISCAFMITLCEQCAKIHEKQLIHEVNNYYLINCKTLFNLDNNLIKYLIVRLLNVVGNENFNSLFQFKLTDENQSELLLRQQNICEFIIRKYIRKLYALNTTFNTNELNQSLFQSVCGDGVQLTVYFTQLGANKNYFVCDPEQNNCYFSVLDNAIKHKKHLQIAYLYLNDAKQAQFLISNYLLSYSNVTYGSLGYYYQFGNSQIHTDLINCKLDDKEIRLEYCKKEKSDSFLMSIALSSIIRCYLNRNDSLIEIEWINQNNLSIIKTNLFVGSLIEFEYWFKEICKKMLINHIKYNENSEYDEIKINNCKYLNELNNLFIKLLNNDSYMVRLFGVMCCIMGNDYENEKKKFVFLLESKENADVQFLRRIVLINMFDSNIFIDYLDVRKISYLKLIEDDTKIRIDCGRKVYQLKCDGLKSNISVWFNELTKFCELKEFNKLETQYLSEDNVPLIIEKCLNLLSINHFKSVSAVFEFDTAINSNNEMKQVSMKMDYYTVELKLKKHINLTDDQLLFKYPQILYFILDKEFNEKFIFDRNILEQLVDLFKKPGTQEARLNRTKNILRSLLNDDNLVFYCTLKRFLFFLYIVLKMKENNLLEENDICIVYYKFLFRNDRNYQEQYSTYKEIFYFLIKNVCYLFNISELEAQKQIKLIEKSIEVRNLAFSNRTQSVSDDNIEILFTVYVFHKESGESVQMKINKKTKVSDVIESIRVRFNLEESKYWCLCEVLDMYHEFDRINTNYYASLERVFPVDYSLLNTMSLWSNDFYFCVKTNEFITPKSSSSSNKKEPNVSENCDFYLLNTNTGALNNTLPNFTKWKNCFLSIRQASICVYKDLPKRRLSRSVSNGSNSQTTLSKCDDRTKPNFEIQIENSIVYYGILCKSNSQSYFNHVNSLTLVNSETKQLYVIEFQSREQAYEWYSYLFTFRYHPCTWSCYQSDNMPTNKPKIPLTPRRLTVNNNTQSSTNPMYRLVNEFFGFMKKK